MEVHPLKRPGLLVEKHFVVLILPFRHRLSPSTVRDELAAVDGHGAWQHWWTRFDDSGLQRILDDTYFFLPHVREMLFPETGLLSLGDASKKLQEARSIQNAPLSKLIGRLGPDPVLRLTAGKDLIGALRSTRLVFDADEDRFEAQMRVDWADVALFPQSVGILAMKVQILPDDPSGLNTDQLSDMLYYVHPVHQLTLNWKFAEWCPEGWETSFSSRDLVDAFLADLGDMEGQRMGSIPSLLKDRLENLRGDGCARYTSTSMGQVYSDAFSYYAFVCLGDDGPPPRQAEPPYDSLEEQAMFEFVEAADSSDPDFLPSARELERIRAEDSVGPWAAWRGVARGNRAIFLSHTATPFMTNTFAHNVESDYLNMWLLATFQKTRLSMMFGQLVRRSEALYGNLRSAQKMWDAYMAFENKHWFSEVTNKRQGRALYAWMQHAMDAEDIHDELSREVGELREHYERKDERTVSRILYFIAIIGPPLSILSALLGATKASDASWQFWSIAGCVVYVAVWFFYWASQRFLRRG